MKYYSQYSHYELFDLQESLSVLSKSNRWSTGSGPVPGMTLININTSLGYETRYLTYGIHGKNVIAKYNPSASYADNLSAMINQIYIEGPHKVSHHCADFEKINVLDVSKNSLSNVAAFKNAVKEAGFSPVLDENGCIHIELKFQ